VERHLLDSGLERLAALGGWAGGGRAGAGCLPGGSGHGGEAGPEVIGVTLGPWRWFETTRAPRSPFAPERGRDYDRSIGDISPIHHGTRSRRGVALLAALVGLSALSSGLAADASAVKRADGPELGRSFVVSRVSGTVLVKTPGSARRIRLTRRPRTIPVGSTVDATRGKVRLVGAVNRSRKKQAGVFYAGAFRVTQKRRPGAVIDLKLVGGNPSVCAAAQSAAAQLSPRVIRRLRSSARGHFRTRGSSSAATIRGTKWTTEDRCDGTRTVSEQGTVQTTSPIGEDDLNFPLQPGQSIVGYCRESAGVREYCVLVFSDPVNFFYVFGIGTVRPVDSYTVCSRTEGVPDDCGQFPLPDDNGDGIRVSVIGCQYSGGADGFADYIAFWYLGQEGIGPLGFNAPRFGPSTTVQCIYENV
jgi:hypothetical protein